MQLRLRMPIVILNNNHNYNGAEQAQQITKRFIRLKMPLYCLLKPCLWFNWGAKKIMIQCLGNDWMSGWRPRRYHLSRPGEFSGEKNISHFQWATWNIEKEFEGIKKIFISVITFKVVNYVQTQVNWSIKKFHLKHIKELNYFLC